MANVRHCSYCNTEKQWTWNGKKLKDGSKVYVDENGARWSGRRCPQCERSRVHTAVRCDKFEKENIIYQLVADGYEILSANLPIRVRKDGKEMTVGVKRAFTRDNKIVVETPVDENCDVVALIFESVRICSNDQLDKLGARLSIFDKKAALVSNPSTIH